MNNRQALDLAKRHRIDLTVGFHTLTSAQAIRVLDAADEWKYRAPANASSSRASYFHAFLVRVASRK